MFAAPSVPMDGRGGETVTRMKKAIVVVLALAAFATSLPSAFAAPGPGDKQCRGANGNDNPHCPPGK